MSKVFCSLMLVVSFVTLVYSQQNQNPIQQIVNRPQWEYKLNIDDDGLGGGDLDRLGNEGWELVAYNTNNREQVVVVLKRQKI